jgi:hypothetical protein
MSSFKLFMLEPDAEAHLFPPFQTTPATEVRLAQLLMNAFHLDHGTSHSFFPMKGCAELLGAANEFMRSKEDRGVTHE